MPPQRKPWFRFYVEAVHDRKLRRLTPAQRWLWVAVLAAARQSPIPGVLLIGEGQPMDSEDLADFAAVPIREVDRTFPLLEKAGMISNDGAGWRVTNWDERQFESDCSTDRAGKSRAMKRQSNVDATTMQRCKPVVATADATRPEAEAEADTDLASAIPVTHDGRRPASAAAAAIVETGLAILAERRLIANGNVTNPAGYRRTVTGNLRQEHNTRIAAFAAGADGPTELTPDAFADWLEPGPQPPPRRPEPKPLGCPACINGWKLDDHGDATPCPACRPEPARR